MHPFKKFLVVCALLYGAYYVMGHHFIFVGRHVNILKKTDLTLDYTFYSLGPERKDIEYIGIENILAIKPLRDAGIGELMVELELITDEERSSAEQKIDYGN